MADLNSWEEDQDAQDDSLSRQAQQQLHMGNPSQAGTFHPGANMFQPGAQMFQPHQQQYQYQQQGFAGYPQYQQQYPQYGQQQQQPQQQRYNQGYNQYGGYQQQAYQQQQQQQQQVYSQHQPQAVPKIAKRGEQMPQPAAPVPQAKNGTEAPKAKVLSIGNTGAAPRTLSIGGDGSAKLDTAGKTKVLSIGGPAPAKPADKPAAKDAEQREDGSAPQAGSKAAAAKAIEKTGEATTAKPAGKTSPTPSGRNSPAAGEKKEGRQADAVAKEQEAEVDEEALKEMYGKEHVNVIFLGHVDAGKSTLGGSILVQTGMVDERTLEKYKREAKEAARETWFLSWVLDLNKEERAKGKTIEVGRGFFETEKRKYSILDAPGHKTFVPNMIGGASQADVGVLVISARKGEYETGFEKGGQTREHAILAKTQGVNKLVVVVNKMDDPTVGWDEDRYKQCISKLTVFLKGLGYNPATDIHCMPVSALTYKGIKDRVPKDECPWYSGPSLLEYLDGMQALERKLTAPFMMPIAAKHRDLGTMIEGKIEAGIIKKENNYLIMPNKETISISALYGETEDEIKTAAAGEQIRLRIRGVEEEDIMPGFVLCTPSRPVHCVSSFEAQIRLLELKSILSAGFNCVLHVHAAQEEVTFAALLHKLEPKTNRKSKKPPGFAKQGMNIVARLQVIGGAGSVCVERFEDYPQLGRFTLRDQGQTIAIGKITKLLVE